MLRALVRATRFMLQPSNEPAVVGSIVEWLKMPREEAALALNDVSFAYSEGAPRDEKSFREIVATRSKLLSSTIPLNEVADFSVVNEIRLK